MKKGYKIGCIALIAVFVISFVLNKVIESHDGPRQSIMFINTSNSTKSVTFEMRDENGVVDTTGYYVDELIKPNESIIKRIPEGDYSIKVWDTDRYLHDKADFVCKLPLPGESNYNLYRFDLAMDKTFVVVGLNSAYEGSYNNTPTIAKIYNGSVPFLIPEDYTGRTFLDLDEKMPSSKKIGEGVYGLFTVSDTLSREDAMAQLTEKIALKVKE